MGLSWDLEKNDYNKSGEKGIQLNRTMPTSGGKRDSKSGEKGIQNLGKMIRIILGSKEIGIKNLGKKKKN